MRPPVSAQEDLFTAAAEGPKAADKVEAEVQMGNWVDPWYWGASMTPQHEFLAKGNLGFSMPKKSTCQVPQTVQEDDMFAASRQQFKVIVSRWMCQSLIIESSNHLVIMFTCTCDLLHTTRRILSPIPKEFAKNRTNRIPRTAWKFNVRGCSRLGRGRSHGDGPVGWHLRWEAWKGQLKAVWTCLDSCFSPVGNRTLFLKWPPQMRFPGGPNCSLNCLNDPQCIFFSSFQSLGAT